MAVKYAKPKGTQDILPGESWKWQAVESKIHSLMHRYGYGFIRIPTFESTDLFTRGVGDTTDVVSKEMYTFEDKGGRSITLRPEGTAGVARAVIENGQLAAAPLPLKCYYVQSNFRYEKMQKGRFREFYQWGVECFGSPSPEADVEVIQTAHSLLCELGLENRISLEINSIGCPKCRPAYHAKLKDYFESHKDKLCPTCLSRLERNPLRILDCKDTACHALALSAPKSIDNLCEECEQHIDDVKTMLGEVEIAFKVNPMIVRGLDYYTKTVFEFLADGIGTQGTVCGGGRYDGLIEQLGGAPTPAAGFGLGLERLLMLLEETDNLPQKPAAPIVYFAAMGDNARISARIFTAKMRTAGKAAEYDLNRRSLKAQMKAAGRLGVKYSMVLGDTEIETGKAKLKNMETGEETEILLGEILEKIN